MFAVKSRYSVAVALIVAVLLTSTFAVVGVQGLDKNSVEATIEIENPLTIARVPGGPSGNTVTRTWTSPGDGTWHQWVLNSGLKTLSISVSDVTSGSPVAVFGSIITFSDYGAYPSGTVYLDDIAVVKDKVYEFVFVPGGRTGSSAQYLHELDAIVPPTPVFTFSISGYTQVAVDASQSYDLDGNIVLYEWEWGDGTQSTGITSSHTYDIVISPRSIKLTVTDDDGLTASKTLTYPLPPFYIAGYTRDGYGNPLPGCYVTVTDLRTGGFLTNVSDAAYGWYAVDLCRIAGGWKVGDVIRASAVKDSLVGSRDVMLTSENTVGGYTQIDVILRTVGPPPVPYYILGYTNDTAGYPLKGCSVTIMDVRTGGYLTTASNLDPGVYMVNLNEIAGGWAVGDIIRVTATIGYMGGSSEAMLMDSGVAWVQIDVVLSWAPVPDFTMSVSPTTITVDASGSYDPDGDIVAYSWDWGDGTSGSGVTASHVYDHLTAYEVTLTVTDDRGATNSTSKTILAPPFYVAGYTYGPDGVTPLANCAMTVTNLNTGVTVLTSSDVYAFYILDINNMVGGLSEGDVIHVTATNGDLSGWGEVIADFGYGFVQLDVTLN